jgi:two-component system, chemotaxis family, sensor kinase CheA
MAENMETRNLNAIAPDIAALNDAAAYLIQLTSDDLEGFGQLKKALHKICEQDTIHEDIAFKLKNAIGKIDALLNDEEAHCDSLLEEINHLLDEALMNMDVDKSATIPLQSKKPEYLSGPGAGDQDYMPEDADLEMMGEFVSESKDLIANAEEALLSLEVDPDDTDAVGKVFRAFHTVKGTSAFLELSLLTEMAHHAENLLSRVRDHEIRYSGGYADLSLRSLDMLKTLVHLVEESLNGAALNKPPGYDDLLGTLADPESAGVSEIFDDVLSPRIGDILVAQGKVKREELEDAVSKFGDIHVGEALVKSNVMTVSEVGQALRTQAKFKGGKNAVESTVRVSTQRLDKLIDMVGEMVIAQSMVAQDEVVTNGQNHVLSKKISHTGKIVRELQDLSMSMRMVPLKPTFQKMARLVRDVARKVGKNVNLLTEGEDTEIDRNLVDIIGDPLVHMIRNSIDHGIELPEERVRLDKPPMGTVKLSAYHSAGNVIVEICDDGKGLNKELILAKALERNLIDKNKPLTDREIYNLIFEPGFSTAQTVTDVSGRGVGMDVVKKNIDTLRGQVEINSEPGKGSVFKIFLPLTLAIIDGMVVRVGQETYVIPTETIVRSIKPEASNISTILNQGKVLALQGNLIPLFHLSELFGIGSNKDNNGNQELVVVVEDDNSQAGIIIDELVGRQQVVIKSLGETLQGIMGISGGAIMPDGRVGLIIDVGGLVRLAHSEIDNGKGPSFFEELKMAG